MQKVIALSLVVCACATDKPKPPALSSVDDQITVEMDATADVDVLDNDIGVETARVIELVDAPTHGTATIDGDGVLHYKPLTEYIGDDIATYRVTNPDGITAQAAVAITVHCTTCALGVSVKLAWDPNAPSDMVLGYRMFLGPTEDPATMVMIDAVTRKARPLPPDVVARLERLRLRG